MWTFHQLTVRYPYDIISHTLFMLLGTLTSTFWCWHLLSSPSGMNLGVDSLGHVVILCLAIWGTAHFPTASSFCVPASHVRGLVFLHSTTKTMS